MDDFRALTNDERAYGGAVLEGHKGGYPLRIACVAEDHFGPNDSELVDMRLTFLMDPTGYIGRCDRCGRVYYMPVLVSV